MPKFSSWIKTSSANLHVFYSAKRAPPHQFWEPIFIGTTYDPPYDERLTLEGKSIYNNNLHCKIVPDSNEFNVVFQDLEIK